MIGIYFLFFQFIYFDQRPQPRMRSAAHPPQPFFYNDAVFILQLHHISDRSKGSHFQQGIQKFLLCPKRLCQLICHHRAADARKRITLPRLFRIYHRFRRRQVIHPLPRSDIFRKRHFMVIRHHHLHPQSVRQLYLRRRRDPVIAGDDQLHPFRRRLLDQMVVQPITVPDTVGDRHIRFGAERPECPHKDRGGTDTVNIIVPDHPDLLPFGNRLPDHRDCPVHIFQQSGLIQIPDIPQQIFPDLLRPADVPVTDQPRQHRRYPELLRYPIKIRLLGSYKPISHFSYPFHRYTVTAVFQ